MYIMIKRDTNGNESTTYSSNKYTLEQNLVTIDNMGYTQCNSIEEYYDYHGKTFIVIGGNVKNE